MIHKTVSFYFEKTRSFVGDDKNPTIHLIQNLDKIVKYQKKVFDFFEIEIEQVNAEKYVLHNHSESITNYINSLENWDSISIFDLDSIPTRPDAISDAIEKISSGYTIYGNAQASQNQIPFAAPNFLNFTREVWEKTREIWNSNKNLKRDIFRYEETLIEGKKHVVDVGERFSIEHRKNGANIILAYPVHNDGVPEWEYNASGEYPRFQWGNGTWFESGTFHGTEIRYEHKQKYFFDACERILRNG